MLTKIDTSIKYGKQHGGFGMQILYPGLIRPQLEVMRELISAVDCRSYELSYRGDHCAQKAARGMEIGYHRCQADILLIYCFPASRYLVHQCTPIALNCTPILQNCTLIR